VISQGISEIVDILNDCKQYFPFYQKSENQKERNSKNRLSIEHYVKIDSGDCICHFYIRHSQKMENKKNKDFEFAIPYMRAMRPNYKDSLYNFLFFIPPPFEYYDKDNKNVDWNHHCVKCHLHDKFLEYSKEKEGLRRNIEIKKDFVNNVSLDKIEEKRTIRLIAKSASNILLILLKFSHRSHMFQHEHISQLLYENKTIQMVNDYMEIFNQICKSFMSDSEKCMFIYFKWTSCSFYFLFLFFFFKYIYIKRQILEIAPF
jgi:hypothetical protein